MNVNRLLIGTLTGFIGYFMGGFVFYTIVFKDILASNCPKMAAQQTEPNMSALVVGNLAAAFLLSYLFEKWANIRTIQSGAINGALIGCFVALSYDSMISGTTILMDWTCVFTDVLIYTIISSIAGALVAFGLSFKRVK
jgi:ABC-type antimicrobial peptide transport system permease subunit